MKRRAGSRLSIPVPKSPHNRRATRESRTAGCGPGGPTSVRRRPCRRPAQAVPVARSQVMGMLPEDLRNGVAVSINRALFSRVALLKRVMDPLDRAQARPRRPRAGSSGTLRSERARGWGCD